MGFNLLGGILGSSNPIASLAISAVTGGLGGIAMDLVKQVASQVAQNVIQDLPLPDFAKSMLKEAVVGSLGEGMCGNPGTSEGIAEMLADSLGMNLDESQSLVDQMHDAMDDMIKSFLENERETARAKTGASKDARGASGASWVMLLAEKLGKIMDNKFEEVQIYIDHVADLGERSLAESKKWYQLHAKPTHDAKDAKSQMPSATAEMQGRIQEFNMIMNAASNAIKTSGQAGSAMASKN